MFCMRKDIHKFEVTGAGIALLACIFIILDPNTKRYPLFNSSISNKPIYATSYKAVDGFLLLSNVPASLYFALNKSLMNNRILPHLLLMNIFTCFGFCAMAIVLANDEKGIAKVTLNRHPETGLFGWLAP